MGFAFWLPKPRGAGFKNAFMIPKEWLTGVKTGFPCGVFSL
jgi:hypothetical protein